jgi:hypothetical protein
MGTDVKTFPREIKTMTVKELCYRILGQRDHESRIPPMEGAFWFRLYN